MHGCLTETDYGCPACGYGSLRTVLGDEIGQDQSYVSRLERGELTEITVTTLERLADVLRVSTDYLLGRKVKTRQFEGEETEQLATATA